MSCAGTVALALCVALASAAGPPTKVFRYDPHPHVELGWTLLNASINALPSDADIVLLAGVVNNAEQPINVTQIKAFVSLDAEAKSGGPLGLPQPVGVEVEPGGELSIDYRLRFDSKMVLGVRKLVMFVEHTMQQRGYQQLLLETDIFVLPPLAARLTPMQAAGNLVTWACLIALLALLPQAIPPLKSIFEVCARPKPAMAKSAPRAEAEGDDSFASVRAATAAKRKGKAS